MDNHSPVLVTENATLEEPPEIVCVSYIPPGHQGCLECKWPSEKSKNCGHKYHLDITFYEVGFTLGFEGNKSPVLVSAEHLWIEETQTEILCTSRLESIHHSYIPCKKT